MSDVRRVIRVENDEGEVMVFAEEYQAADFVKSEIEGACWADGDERTFIIRAGRMEESQFAALREYIP